MDFNIQKLIFCMWNANGIAKQTVEFTLFTTNENIDVCFVSEIHLKSGVAVGAANYNYLRTNRPTAGRGAPRTNTFLCS